MRNKVLIIDDAEFNRKMLTEILEEEYNIRSAGIFAMSIKHYVS